MVHYVDVRDGWDVKECECCFDRAVSYRAQRALNIGNIETFRLELHNMLPSSVPAAPPIHQSRAELEFSLRVPVQALGGLGGVPPLVQLEWKERNAPYQCVEAMLLEWMAEPRVAYPSLAVELGVSRQGQPDVAASTLVQVLGVKESADLKEGFGFFVQHVLSGGLEKAHAKRKEGAGGETAEKTHADGRKSEGCAAREEDGSGGEVRERPLEQAAKGGGGKRKCGRGRNGRGRSNTGDRGDQKTHSDAPTRALLPLKGKLPIIRCTADVEFLLFAGSWFFDSPACAKCISCFARFNVFIPFSALIANFAYRPASVLFNRFVSIFPPPSPEFTQLAQTLHLHDPSPARAAASRNLSSVRDQAEKLPLLMLLMIALNWPIFILGIDEVMKMGMVEARGEAERKIAEYRARKGHRTGSKRNGGGREVGEVEEEDDGEVWEEVRTWCATAVMAWPSSVRATGKWFDPESVASGLSPPCRGSQEVHKRVHTKLLVAAMFREAAQARFRADVDSQDGSGSSSSAGSSSNSSSSSSSSSSSKGSCSSSSGGRGGSYSEGRVDLPDYLKPWRGGVNLLACLREMLLGEPCYRPSSRAEAPIPPAVTTLVSCAPAPCGDRVCGAVGCGRADGGGVKLKNCSGCGKVAYCSRECQKAHWPFHKLTCPGRTSSRDGGSSSSGKVH
ncbi:unnamed protein product [Closterium sp. Naga37s-1]|nr:unnamed protein product [Closterium sp. Naga37s-1]